MNGNRPASRPSRPPKISERVIVIVLACGVAAAIGVPRPVPSVASRTEPSAQVPGYSPSACIGFNTETGGWGEEYNNCPRGYAAYGVADAGGPERPGAYIPAVLVCCPLPAPDILEESHVYTRESCPEDYIATGSRLDFAGGPYSTQLMRCTRINSSRYKLGAPRPSMYWGNGFAGWQGSERIEKEEIPPGIRSAMGRLSKDRWNREGCVGYPWGSLLTQKTQKYCGGFYFRQLQFAGRMGDPPTGTPVKMYADSPDAG